MPAKAGIQYSRTWVDLVRLAITGSPLSRGRHLEETSDRGMILPSSLQRILERHLPWLAERMIVLKAMSFGMIGVVNAAIDASVFFLALGYLTSSLIAANVLGWFVA